MDRGFGRLRPGDVRACSHTTHAAKAQAGARSAADSRIAHIEAQERRQSRRLGKTALHCDAQAHVSGWPPHGAPGIEVLLEDRAARRIVERPPWRRGGARRSIGISPLSTTSADAGVFSLSGWPCSAHSSRRVRTLASRTVATTCSLASSATRASASASALSPPWGASERKKVVSPTGGPRRERPCCLCE